MNLPITALNIVENPRILPGRVNIPIAWDAEAPEWSPEIEQEHGLRFGELLGWIAMLDKTPTRKTSCNDAAAH